MEVNMLISFSVKNFKSIKEESILFLEAENIDGIHSDNIAYPDSKKTIPVLRTAGIWGANASGKSNFLAALECLQNFVEFSHQNDLDKPIVEYHPFKLDSDNSKSPTFFKLDFVGRDKKRYVYTVEFDRDKVNYESLEFYASAKPSALFTREVTNGKLSLKFGSKLSGIKRFSCRANQSYLSVAGNTENSSTQIKDVFRFIRDDINIISNHMFMFSPKILQNTQYLNALAALLACADTGISEVSVEEKKLDLNQLPENLPEEIKQQFLNDFKYQPVFRHNNHSASFSLANESAGTRRLYDIAPMLLLGIPQGKIWIIDEIDSMLHPYILELIVYLFHDRTININNPQLIFTTHCTALMNSDIFRRDQIYFTQKDKNGTSELNCLEQYPVRADANFEKWYRDERFGAVPKIKYDDLRKVIGTIKVDIEHVGGENA